MRLLLVYFTSLVLALGACAFAVWRVDPEGRFYHSALPAALDRSPQCLLADEVLGENGRDDYKLDLFGRRDKTTTVSLGSSRALKLAARPGEQTFTNVAVPGQGIDAIAPEIRRLHGVRSRPLTIYVGIEFFWLNPSWAPTTTVEPSFGSQVRHVLSGNNLLTSLKTLKKDPERLLKPAIEITQAKTECIAYRAGLPSADIDAWRPDGSFAYRFELYDIPPPGGSDYEGALVSFAAPYFAHYTGLDAGRIAQLGAALDLAKSYGWRVVGFTPPYSHQWADRLASAPETKAPWAAFGDAMRKVFGDRGFTFIDSQVVDQVGCKDDQFIFDGWHPTDACAAALRKRLDEASR